MKNKVNIFVSYARSNKALVSQFVEQLNSQLSPSKKNNYCVWIDDCINPGEKWRSEIDFALDNCNIGLLLITPKFLSSNFIIENELPYFVGENAKLTIPVMLQPVDLIRHDLHGIEDHQIFRYDHEGFKSPRSYYECRGVRRYEFVQKVFFSIEDVAEKT
jgi:hypothetical protein